MNQYLKLISYFLSGIMISANAIAASQTIPPACFGTINDWHCIKGTTVTCIAVGYKEVQGKQKPLLVKSIDGGEHWSEEAIPDPHIEGALKAVSCAWDGSICITVGNTSGPTNMQPFLFQTTDHAATWVSKVLPDGYKDIQMTIAICTGEKSRTIPFCVIAGTIEKGQQPLIIQTQDFGNAWQAYEFCHDSRIKNLTLDKAGEISFGNCASHGGRSTCFLYGNKLGNNGRKINYVIKTTDAGNLWSYEMN